MRRLTILPMMLATALAACGQDATGPTPGPTPPPPAAVASVELVGIPTNALAGRTRQAGAIPRAADGRALDDRAVTWASSNEIVASVTATGLIILKAPGKTTITATSEGRSASTELNVLPVTVDRLHISDAVVQMAAGESRFFHAIPLDMEGNVLIDRPVTWASANTTVARVGPDGLIQAVGAGVAILTATSEQATAQVRLEVAAPQLQGTWSVTAYRIAGGSTAATCSVEGAWFGVTQRGLELGGEVVDGTTPRVDCQGAPGVSPPAPAGALFGIVRGLEVELQTADGTWRLVGTLRDGRLTGTAYVQQLHDGAWLERSGSFVAVRR